jgi:hypothetical protein
MGAVAFNITGLRDRTPVIDGRLVEFGHIFSLSARIAAGTSKTGRTHVQAGIFDGVAVEHRIIAVLIDDYVYDGHMPSWTGKLPMDEGTGFFGIVRSADGVIVQFAAYVQKHDP